MNRFVKRALWSTLIAGGITLAGATAANAAEAPSNASTVGCNVVSSTLTTVTDLVTATCAPSQAGSSQPVQSSTAALPQVATDVGTLVSDTLGAAAPQAAAPGGSAPAGSASGGGLAVGSTLSGGGGLGATATDSTGTGTGTGTATANVVADTAVPTAGTTTPQATLTLSDTGTSAPGLPGTGAPGAITVPVPGVGTADAGVALDGLNGGASTGATGVLAGATVPTTGTARRFAVPNLAVPNLGVPNLAVPNLAVPNLAVPNLAVPNLAVPNLAVPNLGLQGDPVPALPTLPALPNVLNLPDLVTDLPGLSDVLAAASGDTGGAGDTGGVAGDGGIGALPGGATDLGSLLGQVVTQANHGLNAVRTAAFTGKSGSLAQTGTGSNPFPLVAGVLLLLAGVGMKRFGLH